MTGVWITTQRDFCYEWGFTPLELFAGAAVHVACPLGADREEQEEWQVGGLRAGNKDRMDGPHGPSGDNVRDVRQ